MKVWVIAIDEINAIKIEGLNFRIMEVESKKAATKLMWIPGIIPVIVPARIPIRIAKMR